MKQAALRTARSFLSSRYLVGRLLCCLAAWLPGCLPGKTGAEDTASALTWRLSGGTKRATSTVNAPFPRLQSSEGKFEMSREIEPVRRSFFRSGSRALTEVARLRLLFVVSRTACLQGLQALPSREQGGRGNNNIYMYIICICNCVYVCKCVCMYVYIYIYMNYNYNIYISVSVSLSLSLYIYTYVYTHNV